MLLKDIDDKTPDLDRLHELLDRPGLSSRQRTDISQQMDNIRTGFRGEKDAAYLLNDSFANGENTIIIHDLRLEVNGRVAQIDHLLISRYCRAYVLETKSFNANLTCNEAGEWTAWYGRGKQGFPKPMASPIEQAKRHASVLADWFKANGLTKMKRIDPVVIVSPTTFAKVRKTGAEQVPVIRADLFANWWETRRNSGGENFLSTIWTLASQFSRADLTKIGELLVANHRPVQMDWEARFGVRPGKPVSAPSVITDVEPLVVVLPEQDWVDIATVPKSVVAQVAQPELGPLEAVQRQETFEDRHSAMSGVIDEPLQPEPTVPAEVETPFGIVAVKKVAVGQYALRHAADDRLSEHVRQVAQGRGRWQPRYRNWLVSGDQIATIADELKVATSS